MSQPRDGRARNLARYRRDGSAIRIFAEHTKSGIGLPEIGAIGATAFQLIRADLHGPRPLCIPFFEVNMDLRLVSAIFVAMGVSIQSSRDTHTTDSQPAVRRDSIIMIEGLVRDVACAVQNPSATATRFNLQCITDCTRQGSALVILGVDGTFYVPISGGIPDSGQQARLAPYIGKYVRVRGTIFERSGLRAIAIQSIEEVKGVHLITDAQ